MSDNLKQRIGSATKTSKRVYPNFDILGRPYARGAGSTLALDSKHFAVIPNGYTPTENDIKQLKSEVKKGEKKHVTKQKPKGESDTA